MSTRRPLGLCLSLSLMLPLLSACLVDDSLPPSQVSDMARPIDQAGTGTVTEADLKTPLGAVGQGCTKGSDCTGVASPRCWTSNINDEPGNLPTLGGYCTANCVNDSDCGAYGTCQDVLGQRFCLGRCSGAGGCRVPDYACFVLSATSGYCFPANRLTCNPTAGDGTCEAGKGACIRTAFDDLGTCRDQCPLGTKTCPVLPSGVSQHCVYINATRDVAGVPTRDRFKGTACFPLAPMAKQEGAACEYFDECQDGLQCNLSPAGDKKCRTLCQVGVVGACPDPNQKCRDVFDSGLGNPGLCIAQ